MTRYATCLLLLAGQLQTAGASQSAPAQVTQKPATRPAAAFTLDMSRLFVDSPEVLESRRAHYQALQRGLADADAPMDRAAAHLAIANWLVAVPTARPATRWVLGMDQAADRQAIAESAEAAQEHLTRAYDLLESDQQARADGRMSERRGELEAAADILEPFAQLFAALALAEDPDKFRSACSEAALRLAAAREADDDAVAACALLWQSFGWALAGRGERALISLPDALTRPEHLPYDFMSRLLRCRVLMDAGHYAAAIALTIKTQAACKRWFPLTREPDNSVDSYRRLAALLQCGIGQRWMEQLRASGSAAAARRLEVMLAGVQQALFAGDQPSKVYHLEPAVPIMVEPPAGHRPTPSSSAATTSAPAAAPASPGAEGAPDRSPADSSPSS